MRKRIAAFLIPLALLLGPVAKPASALPTVIPTSGQCITVIWTPIGNICV